MQQRMDKRRPLIFMLVLLLVISPMSVLANTGKPQTINYVALGDSLAAGVLSDDTEGGGYVGNIVSDLESMGYEISLLNKGVPGAKSGDVLDEQINDTELTGADIITISVGANDVLEGLDASLLDAFDPKYLDTDTIAELQQAARNTATGAIDSAGESVFGAKDEVEALRDRARALVDAIRGGPVTFTKSDVGSMDIEEMIEEWLEELNGAVLDAEKANDALSDAVEAFSKGDGGAAKAALNSAMSALTETSEALDSALQTINLISDFIPPPFQGEVVEFIAQMGETITTVAAAHTAIGGATIALDRYGEDLKEINRLVTIAQDVMQKLLSIPAKIETVGANMAEILGQIRTLNTDAKIYVMGYYNALPYVSGEIQKQIIPLLNELNKVIAGTADPFGAVFVPTAHIFEGNYETYLPNPANIHPSEAGYRAIADAFMAAISQTFPDISEHVITSVAPLPDRKVAHGTAIGEIGLPEQVEVTLDNGNSTHVSIDWNKGDPAYDSLTAGTYIFTGTLTGLPDNVTNPDHLTATIRVIVGEQIAKPEDPDIDKNHHDPIVDDDDGIIDPDGQKDNNTDPDSGQKLPKTATVYYTALLIGMMLSLLGGGLLLLRKRRKHLIG